jgi:DNA-binding NarL/FixJ family response regulator
LEDEGASLVLAVVDDDQGFREMLRGMLFDEGFRVLGEAADGVEAVAMAERLRPDVILMDLRMPRMDGIEATRLIKARLPETQVVFLSAYDDPGLRGGAEEAGAYCYLIKGCPPSIIYDVVRFAWGYKLGLEGQPVVPRTQG